MALLNQAVFNKTSFALFSFLNHDKIDTIVIYSMWQM